VLKELYTLRINRLTMSDIAPQTSGSKVNPVKKALEQKQYGRAFLYIALVVLGAQFAGIIGSVGAAIVIYGIHRVLTNSAYSTKRKWIQSLIYVIAGMLVVFIVESLVATVLVSIWPNAVLSNTLSKVPYSSNSFVSSSTPNATKQATSTLTDLKGASYTDAKDGFKINPPKNWVVNKDQTTSNVEFDDPSQNTVGIETVSSDSAKAYTLSTYAKAVMYNFQSSAGPNADIKIVNQGSASLDGQPAYKYEVTYNYSQNGQTYPFHAIEIMAINNGVGYYIFATSMEQSWVEDAPKLNDSILTFHY
jgi:hypothetical protein